MPNETEERDEIVVVGKRGSKPTPEPQLVINFGEFGRAAPSVTSNPIIDFLRSIINTETDFYISNEFGSNQRKIIVTAIAGISNHPSFASAFSALKAKGAVINIRPVTRSDQIVHNDNGGTFGLVDGAVPGGAIIDIFVRVERGEPLSLTQISITVVHELIHALGVPAFTARLDMPDSHWDREIWRDIFRDYDFFAASSDSSGLSPIIGVPDDANRLVGSVGNSVFVGSASGSIFSPVSGGNILYTQAGHDEISRLPGGLVDRLVNGGGSTIIDFPTTVQPNAVSIIRSPNQDSLSVLVSGKPELVIEGASVAGSLISVRLDGQIYPISSFPTNQSNLVDDLDVFITFFGAYNGEQIGSVAVSDGLGTQFYYRIGQVIGAYAAENWMIDSNTGGLLGAFFKPDLGGSEFTSLAVVASDGITDALISVTVRWAYSNEFEPTL